MPRNLYSDAYAAFAEVMLAIRTEARMTQAELAAKLGLPQSFVSKSERRERRIDVVEFIQIMAALGVEPGVALARVQRAVAEAARDG